MKKDNWHFLFFSCSIHVAIIVFGLRHTTPLVVDPISNKPISVRLDFLHSPNSSDELVSSNEISFTKISEAKRDVGSHEEKSSSSSFLSEEKFLLPPQEAIYIPGNETDLRPQPESPVIVPFPDIPLGKSSGRVVLRLYINSDGQVARAEVEDSDVPIEFELAAVDAFKQARMQPAIKDGKKVNATMKIAVEFESR